MARRKSTKTPSKTTRKRTTKKNKVDNVRLIKSLVGLGLIIFSVLGLFKLGIVGKFYDNLYRIVVGDSYQFLLLVSIFAGAFLIATGKLPKMNPKRNFGFVFTYLGVLIFLHKLMFSKLDLYHNYNLVTWNTITADMGSNSVYHSVGGGMLGSYLYSICMPLFSSLGTTLVSILLIVVGILMLFNVTMEQFSNVTKSFMQHCRNGLVAVKDAFSGRYENYVDNKDKDKPVAKPKAKSTAAVEREDDKYQDVNSFAHKNDSEPDAKSDDTRPRDEDTGFVIDVPNQDSSAPEPIAHKAEVVSKPYGVDGATADKDLPTPRSAAEHNNVSDDDYKLPSVDLLKQVPNVDQSAEVRLIDENKDKLKRTFKSFGVDVDVKKASLGPTITKYEVQPAIGVKVSKIVNLADDLALALAAKDIRIEAPIPGKSFVGIEVPNKTVSSVSFKDITEHQKANKNPLVVPLGKDVSGNIIEADITKMPHLLIAGSTGSGKSVAINTIITGILMKAKPNEVKLILIDPKMVELNVYNGIPHLLIPVVTDARRAAGALQKAVTEMERRYKLFAETNHRNIGEYNEEVDEYNKTAPKDKQMERLPFIVVIVDELSDLMMVAGHEVEAAIVRLAQMARAAGLHIIIATQRPSVDVITGLIKANIPSRIAFAVSSGVDSRTILDSVGAEKLLGRGDMLFQPIGKSKPVRLQGAYISEEEVENVVNFVSSQQQAEYDQDMIPTDVSEDGGEGGKDKPNDEYWDDAVDLIVNQQSASVSMLQRRFSIGYNRAARIVDQMQEKGIVGPSEGSKPRKVLLTPEQLESIRKKQVEN
ncbi:DNA translocase FtsK [Companilactobacillus sp.]|jgi:S-DNA-T family DNA segregation ATPase FtsK/SpoIIIE|uniref:DNA translocase FtsK n=1 Tax=Companilactobacillus sp. TaxID=2767905 RepID=UPI0025C52DBF|nr:DNA translocase FtsK [Companilactobacillus sp.]MCH4008817.1 DNA translocase FtsK [Companilactobacillus sp.]MCH4051004.1 DNA translocase FtsK [Companilactobacillus sp.]MCH4076760.1 DNA translocase FtsK [Companilactobacillus sp.]MCH4125335.1 DNA translocase FtsK [Companilactobacillus sp.]MCH4131875.1 DNA translocase FtsK [Companilactobacillus sp.]